MDYNMNNNNMNNNNMNNNMIMIMWKIKRNIITIVIRLVVWQPCHPSPRHYCLVVEKEEELEVVVVVVVVVKDKSCNIHNNNTNYINNNINHKDCIQG